VVAACFVKVFEKRDNLFLYGILPTDNFLPVVFDRPNDLFIPVVARYFMEEFRIGITAF
jgi:hypothetical protein